MVKYDATISIVTYNNEKEIKTLLDSIENETKGIGYHIYMVDNRSSDKTVEIIKDKMKESERITLIENAKNVGFGRAHNQILPQMDSKYHVYINADV
jgi:GT2 family glycosyltransferase